MPVDVFLILASSGITLVASLLYLVDDRLPPEVPDDPRLHVPYCDPPLRVRPPPLPRPRWAVVDLSTPSVQGIMTLKPTESGEWLVTLECEPRGDSAALEELSGGTFGAVADVRLKGRAELAQPSKRSWKQKPARA